MPHRTTLWRRRNPERARVTDRKKNLKKRYGLTPEQFDAMLLSQRGLCAICDQQKKLVIDHDHRTGRVRGLICMTCNRHLAALDDKAWLSRAFLYLQGVSN